MTAAAPEVDAYSIQIIDARSDEYGAHRVAVIAFRDESVCLSCGQRRPVEVIQEADDADTAS